MVFEQTNLANIGPHTCGKEDLDDCASAFFNRSKEQHLTDAGLLSRLEQRGPASGVRVRVHVKTLL